MSVKLTDEQLKKLKKEYGDAFYILDSEQFRANFIELKSAFSSIYPNFNIAYSYKTNYTPKLCRIRNTSSPQVLYALRDFLIKQVRSLLEHTT